VLTEKELLERAFLALDELVGQQAVKKAPKGVPSVEREGDLRAEIETMPDTEAAAPSLKGQAIELWCSDAGGRVFIVADEEDAEEAIRRFGARRGQVWIPAEIELVAGIEDRAIREEIATFKRALNGIASASAAAGEGVSPEECKARELNRLFEEQGTAGQSGRITAATVRHGEAKDGLQ
jgi:hypothetical protein